MAVATPNIPKRVLIFVAENIDSVTQMEMLLIMSKDAARHWSLQQLAAATYSSLSIAARTLDSLRRKHLVIEETSPAGYRYPALPEEQQALLMEVLEAYRRNLVALSTFIHSKGTAPVKEFARAFNLKREK